MDGTFNFGFVRAIPARFGFVRAVWVSSFAVETRKQTFPSDKFAPTRTAGASAGSFARKLNRLRMRAAG
jgi:hypothetical protein